jgi:hypothetical protein
MLPSHVSEARHGAPGEKEQKQILRPAYPLRGPQACEAQDDTSVLDHRSI